MAATEHQELNKSRESQTQASTINGIGAEINQLMNSLINLWPKVNSLINLID